MSSRSLDIESPMVLLLAMHHPWEFQKISIETFRSFLLDFTLWLLHQKMCSFSRHWFRFQNITDFRRFRLKPSEVLHFLTPNQRPEKNNIFFFNYKFLSQIFQWYILVFFGCCCCSPCSSGGCWWYPCHGSHLIGECATHCCVGIFALSVRQKVLGDLIDKTMFLLGCEMKKAGQCCPKQYGSG